MLTQNDSKVAGAAADYLDGKYDAKIDWTLPPPAWWKATSDYSVKSGLCLLMKARIKPHHPGLAGEAR